MDTTKQRLNAILQQLQETEALPNYDRGISEEEYRDWMNHFDAINALVHNAEQIALIELPVEIYRLLSQVRQAAFRLYPHQPKKTDDDKRGE